MPSLHNGIGTPYVDHQDLGISSLVQEQDEEKKALSRLEDSEDGPCEIPCIRPSHFRFVHCQIPF